MVADNYAGYVGSQFNPANIADSRFKFQMNVVGVNAHLQNNYLQLETPHSLYKFLYWSLDSNFGTQNFDYPFEESYVKERLNGKGKFIYSNASVNAFSMQFGRDDKSGWSIGSMTKAFAKVANLPEAGVKTFLQDLDSIGSVKENQQRLLGQTIDLSGSGASVLAYQQYGVKYARVVKDKRKDFIKVGFGLDYNIGLFGGYFKGDDISYTLTGIDTLDVSSADIEMAYIDPNYYTEQDRRLNDYFGKSKLGRGLGINAGIVYEHRSSKKKYIYKMDRKRQEDRSENKYDWKLGASIVDLGLVNFKHASARSVSISSPATSRTWSDFDTADSWTGINNADTFLNSFFSDVKTDSSFRMFTPATLNISGDYKYKDHMYLSASYSQSLMRNKGKSVKLPSVLTIAPRYEKQWLTVSVPISFSSYYNKVNLGTYVRAGIFYIGSDNLGGFFSGKKTNGANIYTGFNWPIHYHKLEDFDGDGVSDDEDECPDFPGSKYTNGCPDQDGDKIADDEDKCPDEPGKRRTGGCPDYDGDGVAGDEDLCPYLFGDENTKGCPDQDGDGIYDRIDKCPEVAGEKRFDGCIEEQESDQEVIDTLIKVIVRELNLRDLDDKSMSSKFKDWDFNKYEYWPVLGAYNDMRWAAELQQRLNDKLAIPFTIKTIPGVSKYYVTLGKAATLEQAIAIQKVLDRPNVNSELNGKLWWKKVEK